jgi:hypothetical protein
LNYKNKSKTLTVKEDLAQRALRLNQEDLLEIFQISISMRV